MIQSLSQNLTHQNLLWIGLYDINCFLLPQYLSEQGGGCEVATV